MPTAPHDSGNNSSSSSTTLDAEKRKTLPTWIRLGLEKMEREKQRQLEHEEREQQRVAQLAAQQAAVHELLATGDPTAVGLANAADDDDDDGVVVGAGKSKFDSDNESSASASDNDDDDDAQDVDENAAKNGNGRRLGGSTTTSPELVGKSLQPTAKRTTPNALPPLTRAEQLQRLVSFARRDQCRL